MVPKQMGTFRTRLRQGKTSPLALCISRMMNELNASPRKWQRPFDMETIEEPLLRIHKAVVLH